MSQNSRIVVGVTGGIAAYKTVSLVRSLVKAGHDVHVIPTEAALNFVGPATWEAISRNPVHVGLYDDVSHVKHVALGQEADLIVIAPATANTLAQLAHGLAPDLLTNTVLSRRCPLIVAPAMHTEMWENPATQENVKILESWDVTVCGPDSGQLTGEDSGPGRMMEPEAILAVIDSLLQHSKNRDLVGKKFLITAGGTREPLDPVRFLGNRSSGKQGIALATRAQARGAEVTLIAAHVEVPIPSRLNVIAVSTASEMFDAVKSHQQAFDVIIMAAAVSDYRSSTISESKLKKSDSEQLTLTLTENPDILQSISATKLVGQTIVGFAAETGDDETVLKYGREKVLRKGCDYLVVNKVDWSQGFSSDTNRVTVLDNTGAIVKEVSGSKLAVADKVLDTFA